MPAQAAALNGLARTYQVSGDTRKARHHSREALTRYAEPGASEATQIQA